VRSTLADVALPDQIGEESVDLEPLEINSFGAVASQISQLW